MIKRARQCEEERNRQKEEIKRHWKEVEKRKNGRKGCGDGVHKEREGKRGTDRKMFRIMRKNMKKINLQV